MFSTEMQCPSLLDILFMSLMRNLTIKIDFFLVINSETIFLVTAVIGKTPYHSEQLQENKITFLCLSHLSNFPIDSYLYVSSLL